MSVTPDWALAGREGIDFVCCRICGERRRGLSGRHLFQARHRPAILYEEFGLSPDDLIAKDFRKIQSSRREYHPYSKGEWIRAVKEIYSRKGRVSTKYLQRKHAEIYYQGVWLFGGWDEALRAAGFDPDTTRICTSWTRGKIISELRLMQDQGLSLNAHHAMKNHAKVFSGARRQFGSWRNTLAAAGVDQESLSYGIQ
jgi:hypothetical protein